jgi:uncharacterized protein with HEPN domain
VSVERDRRILEDIAERARRVDELVGGGHAAFVASWIVQDALVRNLEIIGEAAKALSGEMRTAHPEVPWREMGRFRDLAIHRYFALRLDIVWSIAEQSIPVLLAHLPALLADAAKAEPDERADA